MEVLKKYGKNILAVFGALSILAGLFWTLLQIYDRLFQKPAVLKYELICDTFLDGDTLQGLEGENAKYILQKRERNIYSGEYDKPKDIDQLQYCNLKFVNIGKKELEISDFYLSDKFGIQFGKYLKVAAVFVKNNQTQKYINFKIIKMANNQIDFSFDVIEPKDYVSLGILIDGNRKRFLDDDIVISGRTQFFDKIKPLNRSSAKLLGDQTEFFPFRIFGIRTDIVFLFSIFIFAFPLMYCAIKYDENIKKKLEVVTAAKTKDNKKNRRKNKNFKKNFTKEKNN